MFPGVKMCWDTKSDRIFSVASATIIRYEPHLMNDHDGCSLWNFPYSSVTISFGSLYMKALKLSASWLHCVQLGINSLCKHLQNNPRQFVGHWYFPLYRYSCPDLVVPYSEELISRPCVAENRFLLVLQIRMSTKNAMGCKIYVASYTHTASAPQKTFPRGFVQKQVTWISQQKIQCIAMQCLHI